MKGIVLFIAASLCLWSQIDLEKQSKKNLAGTTQTCFQVNRNSSGCKVCMESGKWVLRDSTGTGYCAAEQGATEFKGSDSKVKWTCQALPGSPLKGDVACDSADGDALKFYDGTTWRGVYREGTAVDIADLPTITGAKGGLGVDASSFSGVLKMTAGVGGIVSGAGSNCVYADGTSGSCGGATTPSPIWLPMGLRSGSTTIYLWNNNGGTGNTSGSAPYVTIGLTMAATGTSQAATSVMVPPGYAGSSVDIVVKYGNGSTGSTGDVRWQYTLACKEATTAWDGTPASLTGFPKQATVAPAQSTGGNAINTNITWATQGLDTCTAGDWLYLTVERLGDDGADTYAQPIVFLGATIKWN